MENIQVWEVPGCAGPGEEQQRFWGKNETMPDHVETKILLLPARFLAWWLMSFPHRALCLCITGSVYKGPARRTDITMWTTALEDNWANNLSDCIKIPRKETGYGPKEIGLKTWPERTILLVVWLFCFLFLVCKIEKVIIIPCFTEVVMTNWIFMQVCCNW